MCSNAGGRSEYAPRYDRPASCRKHRTKLTCKQPGTSCEGCQQFCWIHEARQSIYSPSGVTERDLANTKIAEDLREIFSTAFVSGVTTT